MNIQELANLITSVGFPIVMCLLMFKYISEENKATRETLSALETAIKTLECGVKDLIRVTQIRYDLKEDEER